MLAVSFRDASDRRSLRRATAMTSRSLVRIAAGALGAAALLTALARSPRPAQAQTLSGFDVFRSNCGGCHDLPDPEEPKRSRQQWDEILTRMVKVRGATLSPREFTAV